MAPRTVVELENLPREEWLEARRGGIGSSDVAGICGLSRHSSQFSVWLDKTGQAEEEPENRMMRMGRVLEEPVAMLFEDATGLETEKPAFMYRHESIDHMLASPDRHVIDGSQATDANWVGELECKTGRNELIWADGPPLAAQLQLTHQMIVTGKKQGWIAVLLNGRDFDFWPMDLDPELAEALIKIEEEFWQLVVNRQEPPADGHLATKDALAHLYREVRPGAEIDITPALPDLRALTGIKAQIKDLERQKVERENKVKQLLGDAEVGLFEKVPYVTWKASSIFDQERFEADEPVLAADFRKTGTDLERLKEERPDLAKRFRKEHAGPRKFLPKKGI